MENQIEEVMSITCAPKYLEDGESFKEGMSRIADALKDDDDHFKKCQEILLDRRFLPAGRIQAAVGSSRKTTAFNCFVSDTIEDDSHSIFENLNKGFQTMRLGGGDGFNFSHLRPKGSLIKSLQSTASGPISFMHIWDSMCETVKSAGHRRGAMMATLRCDHPDIEEFITCKQQAGVLKNFNISVLVTDEFIKAVKEDGLFNLRFPCDSTDPKDVHKVVKARNLWNKIMRNTWEHAEPGVLFIDKINSKNNLYYCEKIEATNPCGEQPLPPNGACLLGSLNLTKYLIPKLSGTIGGGFIFDIEQMCDDIEAIVRMMDNIIDETIYPLPEQEAEAKSKRRMGIGITGLANVLGALRMRYGSEESLVFIRRIMTTLRDNAYLASIEIAKEKGSFPLFDAEKYLEGNFIKQLPRYIQEGIKKHGIRNSHLLSIAPTGTISLWAYNISSGIEPVFATSYNRNVFMPDGSIRKFYLEDYAKWKWGIECITSDKISAQDHINVLCEVSKLVDSSCSKTANIGDEVTFEEFKDLYMMAYDGGASGCTTYRPSAFEQEGDVRGAVLERIKEVEVGASCFINEYGERECAD